MSSVFNDVYVSKRWGDNVLSGPGSSVQSAQNIIPFMVEIIKEKNIKKIVDGSCGDCTWIGDVLKEFPDIVYVGTDISSIIIERNKTKFADKPNWRFYVRDIETDPIEDCDLFIFRHTMMHLTMVSNMRILDNIKRNTVYALLTNHEDVKRNPTDDSRQSLIRGKIGGYRWKKMNLHLDPLKLDETRLVSKVKESSNNTNEFLNLYCFS